MRCRRRTAPRPSGRTTRQPGQSSTRRTLAGTSPTSQTASAGPQSSTLVTSLVLPGERGGHVERNRAGDVANLNLPPPQQVSSSADRPLVTSTAQRTGRPTAETSTMTVSRAVSSWRPGGSRPIGRHRRPRPRGGRSCRCPRRSTASPPSRSPSSDRFSRMALVCGSGIAGAFKRCDQGRRSPSAVYRISQTMKRRAASPTVSQPISARHTQPYPPLPGHQGLRLPGRARSTSRTLEAGVGGTSKVGHRHGETHETDPSPVPGCPTASSDGSSPSAGSSAPSRRSS